MKSSRQAQKRKNRKLRLEEYQQNGIKKNIKTKLSRSAQKRKNKKLKWECKYGQGKFFINQIC